MTEEEQKKNKEEPEEEDIIEDIDEELTEEDVMDILKVEKKDSDNETVKEEPKKLDSSEKEAKLEAPEEEPKLEVPKEEPKPEDSKEKEKEDTTNRIIITKERKDNMNPIFALRTTANREDQVLDFVSSNVEKKGLEVYSIINPHGLRGYIFLEAKDRQAAEESFQGVPYARGLLPNLVKYEEIEHMLEQVKKEINIQKNDIVEIISGPFKREKAKVTRIDQQKEEVIVELLESAIPIPITVKIDSVKVIRRDSDEDAEEEAE